MKFLLFAVALAVVGPALCIDLPPTFKEGNLTCSLHKEDLSTYLGGSVLNENFTVIDKDDEFYNEIKMAVLYKACNVNNITTYNYTEGKFRRLPPRSSMNLFMREVEKKEKYLTYYLAIRKKSNMLEFTKKMFGKSYFDSMVSEYGSPEMLEMQSHSHMFINSCNIANFSIETKLCFDFEEASKIVARMNNNTITSTTATESSSTVSEAQSEKESLCKTTVKGGVVYQYECEGASKILVHSCIKKNLISNETFLIVDRNGCSINGAKHPLRYYNSTMARGFFGSNMDVQCLIKACYPDQSCDIESSPKC